MVDVKLISCKTTTQTFVGLAEFEIVDEEITGGVFRRSGATFYKKTRRVHLKSNVFPVTPGYSYIINVLGELASYQVKVLTWDRNEKDEWEWIIFLP